MNRWTSKGKDFVAWLRTQIDARRVGESTLASIPYLLAATIVGLIAVGYARLFHAAESWVLSVYTAHPAWAFVGAPGAFLLGWWLVSTFAPAASGSGIPQLMAATEVASAGESERLHPILGVRVFVVKILSSIVCVLGGGAIGREGPTLQLAGSAFYLTHRLLQRTVSRYIPTASVQSMIITGGAAGLAAAFNTPLGGIVYAIEELAKVHLSHFRTSLIQAVIVSGLTAQLLLGPYLYLGYPIVSAPSLAQVPFIILISATIGICGALTGRALYAVVQWRNRAQTRSQQALITVVSGLAFASLIYFCGAVGVGSGKDVMSELLFSPGPSAGWTWPISRFLGNFLSYASGCAGGIFAPALATGATLGSLVSSLVPNLNEHLLILVGMIAFLTGLTRVPFTSFVLVLEMTDRHSVLFAMMIGAMSANAAAHIVDSESLYERIKEKYLPKTLNEN